MSEAEEDPSQWSYPLTERQLKGLEPHLKKLAAKYGRCADDYLDLIQTALVALIADDQWTDAIETSDKAMNNYQRQQRRRGWTDATSLTEGSLESAYETVDQVQLEELKSLEWLRVPEQHRQAAVMKWTEGWTNGEIAEELGVSATTVSQWLFEVRDVLQETVYGKQEE